MIFETQLYAGASWNFTKSFSDYPAAEWDCILTLKKDAGNPLQITATKAGNKYIFTASAAHTSALSSGTYKYQFKFTNTVTGGIEIKSGYETIEALLETVSDSRTHNGIMLAALQATLEGRATKEILNMSYKGRAFQLLTLQELREAILFYEAQIKLEQNEEKIKNGEETGRKLLIGFN